MCLKYSTILWEKFDFVVLGESTHNYGTLKGNLILGIWCAMETFVDDMSKSSFLLCPIS